jgi:phage protein U
MYAQLGSIQFENLKSFTQFDKTGSAIYAEHALIDSKPRLQRTGSSLDELSIAMRFHVGFPCIPTEEVGKLKTARDEGEVLTLSWGNGRIEGNFVITQLSETIEDQDREGNIFAIVVSCTLLEFSTANRLQQQQDQNRKKAAAVGKKKPVAKKLNNPVTCSKTVTEIMSAIESNALKINKTILEQGGLFMVANKGTIQSCLTAVVNLCDNLFKRSADPNFCGNRYPDIGSNATKVKNESMVLNITVLTGNSLRLQPDNKLFQKRVSDLKRAAQPLITNCITNKE